MGAISSLILSPCISPALATALTYISTTHDHWFGAAALFLMGLGSGIWLPIIGLAGARFIPKRGNWLLRVNVLMGVLLLAVATDIVTRLLPNHTLTLWGAWGMLSALIILIKELKHSSRTYIMIVLAGALALAGSLWFSSGLCHGTDFLHPWQHNTSASYFDATVKNIHTLNNALQKAHHNRQTTLIEFYADWCSTCRGMDRTVFSKAIVQNALKPLMKIRVDITEDNEATRTLKTQWHVIAPPTMIWLDQNGKEISTLRIIGKASAEQVIETAKHLS